MKRRGIVASSVVACASLACSTGPPAAVGEWFETAYTPTMQRVMDPALAPWTPAAAAGRTGGAGPGHRPPSSADMRAGCGEALRRIDDAQRTLERAPDRELAAAVRTYVRDLRARLRTCAETGRAPESSTALDAVTDRLRRLGVRLPEG